MSDERISFTIAETAEQLGVSPDSVRNAIARGDLPSFRFGHRVLVPAEAVHALAEATAR